MKKLKKVFLGSAVLGTSTVALGLASMAAQGAWRTYLSDDPVGRDFVRIESKAPLESMLTRTNKIKGEIKLNPDDILQDPQATFYVDLTSLDTGIALRNEHMRAEGFLNTAKYPTATFTLKKITKRTRMLVPVTMEKEVTASGEGELDFHGVKKTIPVQLTVKSIAGNKDTAMRLPGDLLHVQAKFVIKLDQFGVVVPDMAKLKIANDQQAEVDVFTSTELPKPPQG